MTEVYLNSVLVARMDAHCDMKQALPHMAVGLPLMPPPLHMAGHSMYYGNPLMSPVGAVLPFGQPMISLPPNYPGRFIFCNK